jgi:predicted nuclease of restriction endonuclease-like (RecB) superfamily
VAIKNQEISYLAFLQEVKLLIREGHQKAAFSVNATLLRTYWNLGQRIAQQQSLFEGRNNYIDTLARDLKIEFPLMTGFSKRNLFDIRRFYLFYASLENSSNITNDSVRQPVALKKDNEYSPVQQVAALNIQGQDITPLFSLPWGHHLVILNKVKDLQEARFYIHQCIQNAWSRSNLTLQIEQKLYQRSGKAISNFQITLPEEQAQMADQILKDPYNFSFLTLEKPIQELELEKLLVQHITHFLLELGKGFAFMGRQFKLAIGEKDYYLDLLFYHTQLNCYIVIELKTVAFEPEFAGKLNFYLSAVDSLIKKESDQPTIGILLCKSKDKIEVEFALRDINKPIGVSDFILSEALPNELKNNIPTVEEFENELNKIIDTKNA